MNPADESQASTTTDRRRPGIQRHQPPEVADRLRAAGQISPLPGTTTDFSPNGGVVMYNPAVFAIYWGQEYGTSATGINALAQQFNAFFAMVLDSNYMDPLSQYNVNHGTFLGSTWVDHDPNAPQTLDEGGIQTILASWLDAGMLPVKPAPDEHDLLFVIFAPAEVTLKQAGHLQTDLPPNGFCAYHYWGFYQKSSLLGQSNLFWAAITSGSETSIVAHELVEAFTDRDYNGWRSGVTEIGDACNGCGLGVLQLNGFRVASYWLNDSGRCLQQSDLTPAMPINFAVNVMPAAVRGVSQNYVFTVAEAEMLAPVQGALVTLTNGGPGGGTEITDINGQATFYNVTLAEIEKIVSTGKGPPKVISYPPGYTVQATNFNMFAKTFW